MTHVQAQAPAHTALPRMREIPNHDVKPGR